MYACSFLQSSNSIASLYIHTLCIYLVHSMIILFDILVSLSIWSVHMAEEQKMFSILI